MKKVIIVGYAQRIMNFGVNPNDLQYIRIWRLLSSTVGFFSFLSHMFCSIWAFFVFFTGLEISL